MRTTGHSLHYYFPVREIVSEPLSAQVTDTDPTSVAEARPVFIPGFEAVPDKTTQAWCKLYRNFEPQPIAGRRVPPLWMSPNGRVSDGRRDDSGWLEADKWALRCGRFEAGVLALGWPTYRSQYGVEENIAATVLFVFGVDYFKLKKIRDVEWCFGLAIDLGQYAKEVFRWQMPGDPELYETGSLADRRLFLRPSGLRLRAIHHMSREEIEEKAEEAMAALKKNHGLS